VSADTPNGGSVTDVTLRTASNVRRR
jgi:hypothetical protein